MTSKWHGGKGDSPRPSHVSRAEKDLRYELAFGNTPALNKCSCGNGVQLVNTIVRCAKCNKSVTGHSDKEAILRWNQANP